MVREKDYTRFALLMGILAKATARQKPIDKDVVEVYFQALQDMEYRAIEANAYAVLRKDGSFFPAISDLACEPNHEDEAQQAYEIVNKTAIVHGHKNVDLMRASLKRQGRPDLIPSIERWAEEMCTNENITATRAQFIRQYAAMSRINRHKELTMGYQKQLGGNKPKEIEAHIQNLSERWTV